MDAPILIAIVVVIVLLAVAALVLARQQRSRKLQEGFGPEYDRTVSSSSSKRQAEAELKERTKRHDELDIKPLPEADRKHYAEEWEQIQKGFVDEPRTAIESAQRLVDDVMAKRGYPVSDFEQRAADVSVDHPELVENYRAAHDISSARDDDQVTTEQLRQGVVHYRSLFAELLDGSPSGNSRGS